MHRVTILLLAAGAARRMRGRDKLLMPVEGMPLLRRQARAACATGARVLVTLPPDRPRRRQVLAGLDVDPVIVADAPRGMSASFQSALPRLLKNCMGLMIVPADMPEITQDDMRHVGAFFSAIHPVRACDPNGTPGHPVLFPRRFFNELGRLRGDQGARSILTRNRPIAVALPGAAAVTDLDTPEAWETWLLHRQ